jgi:hypothetical protein
MSEGSGLRRVQDKSPHKERITVKMPKVELDAILAVDAAVGDRQTPHERPTVMMPAVVAG